MAQSFDLPVGTDRLNVAIKSKIADSLEALRTTHSGTSSPTSTVVEAEEHGQHCLDQLGERDTVTNAKVGRRTHRFAEWHE